MKCDCGTISYASCTKPASHKQLGIYLSNFSELTIKFTNILKTNFLIEESYTCSLNKPVYVWPTQSTQSVKTVVYLRRRSHIDYYRGSALKLSNRPTCCRSLHRMVGKLIWPCGSKGMDQNSKKGGEGSKNGSRKCDPNRSCRFWTLPLLVCFFVSVCSIDTWEKSGLLTLTTNIATCCRKSSAQSIFLARCLRLGLGLFTKLRFGSR